MTRAIFYTHQTSGVCVGVCACDRMHQMEKTEYEKLKKCYILSDEKSTYIYDKKLEPGSSKGSDDVGAEKAVSYVKAPKYQVYRDFDLEAASKTGSIAEELVHKLVRATIHSMVAVAFEECNRKPNNKKLEEVAKSVVLVYPPLRDPKTSHVC